MTQNENKPIEVLEGQRDAYEVLEGLIEEQNRIRKKIQEMNNQRPMKRQRESRSRQMNLLVTETMYLTLKEKSRKYNISMNSLINQAILEYLRK